MVAINLAFPLNVTYCSFNFHKEKKKLCRSCAYRERHGSQTAALVLNSPPGDLIMLSVMSGAPTTGGSPVSLHVQHEPEHIYSHLRLD